MSVKWLIPLFMIGVFFMTPLSSLAAPVQQTSQRSTAVVNPQIKSGTCNNNDYVWIYYNYGNNIECFGGDGYLGLGSGDLYNVVEVWSGNNCGWLRSYTSSGSGSNPTFNSSTDYYNGGNVINYKVTQIDIEGQGCIGQH